jgi:Gpi18-like mannosyltransferase
MKPDKNRLVFISIAFFLLIILAITLRIFLFRFINNDLSVAFIPWYEYLIHNGGLTAIPGLVHGTSYVTPFSYSPPYLYLLAAAIPLTKFFSPVYVIKTISILFDFVSAYYVYKIIALKSPSGILKWAGFLCVCFAPTVIINSAYWGQFEGIYTSFFITSIYFLLTRKHSLSLFFFATAIAFKIQALLFAPIFVVLLFRGKIRWQWFLLVPAVYFLWMLPAYLFGYPLSGTFTTYLGGTNALHSLTMNAPNLYVAFSNQYYDILLPLGLILAMVICGLLIWFAIRNKIDNQFAGILFFVMLVAIVLPFVLPKMHERYFYPATVISIVLPFYLSKFRLVPITLQCTSLLSSTSYLRGYEVLPLAVPALMNTILVCVLVYFFMKDFQSINSNLPLQPP